MILQFSTGTYNAVARFSRPTTWLSSGLTRLFSTNVAPTSSVAETFQQKSKTVGESTNKASVQTETHSDNIKKNEQEVQFGKLKNKLLQIFNTDKELVNSIKEAKNIGELLNIAKKPNQEVDVALKIMSLVTTAINSGRMNITKKQENSWIPAIQNLLTSFDAASLFKNISVESEFSKLSTLSVPSMVKVLSVLSANKYRHSPLLRFLIENILENSDVLAPKLCTSLLYSICSLNFPNTDLINKVLNDLMVNLKNVDTSLLLSALISAGILRYRDDTFLDAVCIRILEEKNKIKPEDFISVAVTLATFNKTPMQTKLLEHIRSIQQNKISGHRWIDLVWALVVLNEAQSDHYTSVLSENFVSTEQGLTVPKLLKLQNINAAAQYLEKDYHGELLSDKNKIPNAAPQYTQEKQKSVEALHETLMQYLKNPSCFTTGVDIRLGFLIDAIVHFNSAWEGTNIKTEDAPIKVAVMLDEYDCYSLGTKELLGIYHLQRRLLSAMGYHVLCLHQDCFSPIDKLTKREAYMHTVFDTFKKQLQQ